MSQTRFNIYIDDELLKRVDAKAKEMGFNRSEFTRYVYEWFLSNSAATQGVDATVQILRKLLQDEVNPQFNRMAKMIAKTTKASATSMYLDFIDRSRNPNVDPVKDFRDAEAKAVQYLNNRE